MLYHYGPEKLVIGRFCALGTGVRFIMNGANHRMDGPSTFPFPTMGGSWSEHFDLLTGLPNRGTPSSATTSGSATARR
ncbi:CatB-related O-acetyltransferase [Streptomyces tanashiensis]